MFAPPFGQMALILCDESKDMPANIANHYIIPDVLKKSRAFLDFHPQGL
jgi:hypothetical protein